MNIQHLRIARPTDRLDELIAFYERVLDLTVIGAFQDHEGFDGVMLGDARYRFHLEFTHQRGHESGSMMSPEHLLVFYLEDDAWAEVQQRIAAYGIAPVPSYNPYWDRNGITIEDPDGQRIVLCRGAWTIRASSDT